MVWKKKKMIVFFLGCLSIAFSLTLINNHNTDVTVVIDAVTEMKSSSEGQHDEKIKSTKQTANNVNVNHDLKQSTEPKSARRFSDKSSSLENKEIPFLAHFDGKYSKTLLETKKRLDDRLVHVRNVCKNSNYSSIGSHQVWDRLKYGRLTFCSIPKGGTTFLSRNLNDTIEKIDKDDSPFPKEKHKRFMLSREPFSRLVSAFFSKIVGHPYWWEGNVARLIKPFRKKPSDESIRCGHDATFSEYVKFVLEMHRNPHFYREVHFLRTMEVCNVCFDIPDFVGKLENLKEDLMYILGSVNLKGRTNEKFIEVQHMAKLFLNYFNKNMRHKNCGPIRPVLERYWWSQQALGLIPLDYDMPITENECQNLTDVKFADIAWTAYQSSLGRINARVQRRKVMTDLFRQISMEERMQLVSIFSPECELFGYECQPDFVFPERSVVTGT